MRATLTTVSVAALLAAGAGTASARPDMPAGRADAAIHAAAMRAQGLHHRHLDALAASGAATRGLHYEQLAAVAASRESTPASTVRVTRAADGGFDWADAGIGAGLAAALLLSAAGVSTLRRQHAQATR
jgi:hypothetical protein